MALDPTMAGYVACALWSTNADHLDPEGTGRAGSLEDHFDATDIASDALATMQAEVDAFLSDSAGDLDASGLSAGQVGHDLWLTRNRHGAGFWDRGLPDDLGKRLTDAAHALGECDIYAGDDGRLYVS